MLIIIASIGCALALLVTIVALAEVLTSPSLPSAPRWKWVISLLIFTAFAGIAWFLSRTRAHHAPVNVFSESGTLVSRGEMDDLIGDIDSHRLAST